ncbi:MAG: hypothetical protein JWL79_2958 [Frankiales bacterium]|nr:hypothetical protein [Frankiales bacterium]
MGLAGAFAGATAFGITDAHLYLGRGAGFWVSNVSSVWLLIPFVAGATLMTTRRSAALLGLTLTLVALAAFYGWAVVQGANQFTSADLRFLGGGLFTGPTFGLTGRLWSERRRFFLGVPLGLAFVFEPYAWFRHVGRLPNPHLIWFTEAAFGVMLLFAFLALSVDASRGRTTSAV